MESNNTTIAEYSATETALLELEHKFKGLVVDVATKEGLKAAKDARSTLRGYRTSLETKRKELKAPVLEQAALIDSEAKRITTRITALEDPIAAQIKAEEERTAKAEAARVEALEREVAAIKDTPAQMAGKTAAQIQERIDALRAVTVDESWQEFRDTATMAKSNVLLTLQDMHKAVSLQEAEAVRLAAEREELEKLRRQAAERDEAAAKQRAEETARQEAANREAADKLAKERAEFEKQQAEANAKREAEDRAAAEARVAEDRKAQEAREAEEKRQREEREYIEAERKAVADRERKAREEEEARQREIERKRLEGVNARELLGTFLTRFGHLDEFADVVTAIKALPSNVKKLGKKAA